MSGQLCVEVSAVQSHRQTSLPPAPPHPLPTNLPIPLPTPLYQQKPFNVKSTEVCNAFCPDLLNLDISTLTPHLLH